MGSQNIQDMKSNESGHSSVYSASPCTVSSPLLWDTVSAQSGQYSLSKRLKLKDSEIQHLHGKQLGIQLRDLDSCSFQSTGQSFHEVGGTGGGRSPGQFSMAQYGMKEASGWQDEQVKLSSPLGTLATPASQVDCNSAITHITYPYVEHYYGGVLMTYGPQAVMHPPMLAMVPGRVPLPLAVADGSIYVNPKQYHGILRRREARAKLGIQSKQEKGRKMYLHESRHQHAMKRVRGPGGRFLNTKLLESQPPTSAGENNLGSALQKLGENQWKSEAPHSETSNMGASAACSEVTSSSNNDDVFEQPEFGFTSAFRSHVDEVMQDGGGRVVCNGR